MPSRHPTPPSDKMKQTRAQVANAEPPKDKATLEAKQDGTKQGEHNGQKHNGDEPYETDQANHKKRKNDGANEPALSPPATKAARTDTTSDVAMSEKPSLSQILRFLLSSKALDLTIPDSEKNMDKDTRIYANSTMTPFEELLSAVVLSRPISHKLGQRTIRTFLNPPYNFTTPGAIREAGRDQVLKALWEARTQHKDKTADEAAGLAEIVCELFAENEDDASLEKCREGSDHDMCKEREWLKKEVKGLGATGLDIFCRRVQWMWEEVYPFVDKRTADALEDLGLPGDAEGLRNLMHEQWKDLDATNLGIDKPADEEARRRRVFVLLLERAVGASLEKNSPRILSAALGWDTMM